MYGASIGQSFGIQLGSFLGRQIVLGACRDDPEDFERRPMPPLATRLPARVDLRGWTSPVEDQGALGSCTANALAGAVEYLVRRARGDAADVSRLFVYFQQRLWDGSVREDVGASIADGIRVLRHLGAAPERAWPYQRELFAVQPPESVYALAEQHQIADWWSLDVDADALRSCLARGFPVTFGTRVTESFMRPGRDGVIPMPGARDRDDARHGRHALLLVGYDDARRSFLVRNSWGEDWGDRGHCWMPYAYVANRSWTRSCWAIRASEATELEPVHAIAAPRVTVSAPPSRGPGSSGGAAMAGTALGVGAQLAVGALTGSGFLAGLAGGVIAGLTPGVAHAVRGRDPGAIVDRDKSAWILERLRSGGPAPAYARAPEWDDHGAPTRTPGDRPAPPAAVPSSPAPASIPIPEVRAPEPVRLVVLPSPFRELHASSGGDQGALGPATHEPIALTDAGWSGHAVRCARGAMFAWDAPRVAPFAVPDRDPCFRAWLESGAARSPLSWPTGPIETTPELLIRQLPCVRGVVVEHPVHGTHPIHGAVFALWASDPSALGAPLGPPQIPADPREPTTQRFAYGTVRWSAATGASIA